MGSINVVVGVLVAVETIYIRSQAKANGLTMTVFGALGIIIFSTLFTLIPDTFRLPLLGLICAALVALCIGILKLREPNYSLVLDKEKIRYIHRRGYWQLPWHNIQRVDIPRVSRGLEQMPLALIGIKIKDYEQLLENISPRLASNLLMQQRALLLHDNGCEQGQCYSESLLESEQLKLPSGTTYSGIKAMFGHRMLKLRQQLGYDLFIETTELDREPEDFVLLLRQCQQSVLQGNYN